ncbi:MAG: GNAT family N-acetyltransferase [Pseudomonadota bacterium]
MTEVLGLVKRNFREMEDRIDPPSSVSTLTIEDMRKQAHEEEVWTLGAPPYACVFFSCKNDVLYVGRLAVDKEWRRNGLARRLLDLAEERAKAMGLVNLELATRVELKENHAAFERLGFTFHAYGTHKGYSKPTYLILRKAVSFSDQSTIASC